MCFALIPGPASVAYCVHVASDRKWGVGLGRRLVLLKLGVSSEPLLSVSFPLTVNHSQHSLCNAQAPPKQVPKTLENTRILDETIVLPDDEEILQDEKTDEFAGYFDCKITPKVLIISVTKPSSKTHLLMRELKKCIPNSEIRQRWGIDLKKIIPQAVEREYTDILVVNEDKKIPNGLLIIHLPEGPTAHFKLTSFKRGYEIKVRSPLLSMHSSDICSAKVAIHTHIHTHTGPWSGNFTQARGDLKQLHDEAGTLCGTNVCFPLPK